MVVQHDINSLDRPLPNLFANDHTSLEDWVKEDIEAKKRLDAASRILDNDLDLSWHMARVAIYTQDGADAKGLGLVNIRIILVHRALTDYEAIASSNRISMTVSKLNVENPFQWFRFEKTRLDDRWSPWLIKEDDKPDGVWSLANRQDGTPLTFNQNGGALAMCHWYITCTKNQSFRILSALTGGYLGNRGKVDVPEINGVVCLRDGLNVDTQPQWQFRRLPKDDEFAAAVAQKKALQNLQFQAVTNNLDPSWHNANCNIFTRKGFALDISAMSGTPVRWVQGLDRANRDQFVRLRQLQPGVQGSPWLISFVIATSSPGILFARTGTSQLDYQLERTSDQLFTHWLISWDSAGGFRIWNEGTKMYLDLTSLNADPDTGIGTLLTTREKAEGQDAERQLWRIERAAVDAVVDVERNQLPTSWHNAPVVVKPLNSATVLDMGGSLDGLHFGRVYFVKPDPSKTSWRNLLLEKVDPTTGDSPWKIKVDGMGDARSYMFTRPGKPEWAVTDEPQKTDQETCKWRIRTTNVPNVYRIQNLTTKLYLEVTNDDRDDGVWVRPLDISAGDKQLFTIEKRSKT